MTTRTSATPADHAAAVRLRRAAADSAAWSLFADDDAADELARAAHDARVMADELDGYLPLGLDDAGTVPARENGTETEQ